MKWCPYPDCSFSGTDDEVDDHRCREVAPGGDHAQDAQEGSNLGHPREGR